MALHPAVLPLAGLGALGYFLFLHKKAPDPAAGVVSPTAPQAKPSPALGTAITEAILAPKPPTTLAEQVREAREIPREVERPALEPAFERRPALEPAFEPAQVPFLPPTPLLDIFAPPVLPPKPLLDILAPTVLDILAPTKEPTEEKPGEEPGFLESFFSGRVGRRQRRGDAIDDVIRHLMR